MLQTCLLCLVEIPNPLQSISSLVSESAYDPLCRLASTQPFGERTRIGYEVHCFLGLTVSSLVFCFARFLPDNVYKACAGHVVRPVMPTRGVKNQKNRLQCNRLRSSSLAIRTPRHKNMFAVN